MIVIRNSVKIVFISLIFFISIACVFAQESTDLNETDIEDSFSLHIGCEAAGNQSLSSSDIINSLENDNSQSLSSSDIINSLENDNSQSLSSDDIIECLEEEDNQSSDYIINITQDNIKQVFRSGTLRNNYSNYEFFITEDLSGLGLLKVRASNVTINGLNHTLTNTVFSIESTDNVTLINMTLIESEVYEKNEYAALSLWRSNNVNLYNLNINVTAPRDSDAYGIFSEGSLSYPINNLSIVNCSINLYGDNRGEGRDYALRMEYSPNAKVINNTIEAVVSLRSVAFIDTTAVLDSEFSLAVGIENCGDLIFDGNIVKCSAGARPECAYPTLDAIYIGDSQNCNFTNNEVYLSDYLSYKGMPNYLYGLDIYRDDYLLVENNTLRVETTGGAYAAGTAYPIQLTGPAEGIVIQYNDIYSKNNGPNIGIYSQNFNGANYITILNNYINVTGLSGNHSWALVAGIEAQDDNDIIMNNIIEVHNVQKVGVEDNIYGISYSQKTDSTHSYRVVNNTVISDGYYLSYMLDADNTTVTNNTLVRTDKYADTDYDPFKRGSSIAEDTDSAKNNDFSGNRVITVFEYDLEHQSNELDAGEVFNYTVPTNVNNLSNIINGSGILPWKPGNPGGNPLLPGNNGGGTFSGGNGNGGGFHSPYGTSSGNGWPDLSDDDGKSLSRKNQGSTADTVNSFNNYGSSDNSYNHLVATENSTSSSTPSVNGVVSSGASSDSSSEGGGAGSVGAMKEAKAYEITKDILKSDPDDIIQFVILTAICEILLIIGYKRRESVKFF